MFITPHHENPNHNCSSKELFILQGPKNDDDL